MTAVLVAVGVLVLGLGLVAQRWMSCRGFDRWIGPYLIDSPRRRPVRPDDPVHLLLCIADHYEPCWGRPSADVANARVARWVEQYPRLFGKFRDNDGYAPRHTFFYPIDEYVPEHVDALAELCRAGFGETEIHLHHDRDTAANLHATLLRFQEIFEQRHGLLSRNKHTRQPAFGFVHGNWALDNSQPDGRRCGVNNELDVLRESGCYADFTLPSYPDPTQTRKSNSLYYAVDDPARPRSHDYGRNVGTTPAPANALMLIQGPLLLNWKRRKWGLLPGIENACIQENQPPTMERLDLWLRARIQVPARPDWFFVKLHTHGAPESNQRVLLGDAMVRFHQDLARRAQTDRNFHYHYVTAREMYNLVRAAEAGWTGSVASARDFELVWDTSAATVLPGLASEAEGPRTTR